MNLKLTILLILLTFKSFSAVDHWETAVYEDDIWRYLVPTAAVPVNWNMLSYNDAAWNQGPGGFGYGDGDDNTTFGSTITCFQRIVFNISDVNAIDAAILNIDFDDGFVAYLNGVEITRYNVGVGQEGYNNLATGQHEAQMYGGGSPDQFFINACNASLVSGNNVLAIQTHNATAGSSDMSSRVWLSLGINNTSNNYGATPAWFNPPIDIQSSKLPIVVINTAGCVSIPDEPKVDATMGIIYNGEGAINNITDPFNEYNGNIGIELRGASSQQLFPKKQYGFETRDNFGVSHDVTMFNMAYDNDWILYAPYSDKSLIRNVMAYQLGWDVGSYAPRTKLCEVILNGQYQGVYVLTEKIKRKDGKVGFNDVEPTDNSGNELTGDYIIKIDKLNGQSVLAWYSPYPPFAGSSQNPYFQLHDPEWDSLTSIQKNYIETYVTDFETALDGPNFTDPINGYAPYIDVPSFINFFLVNELSRNVDGYRISSFLHKLRTSEGGKLFAGPLWDFNLAFGNANYCSGGNSSGWEINFYQQCPGDGWQNPFWWEKLLQDPAYAHDVNCKWQEMRQGTWHTDSLMQRIDDLAFYLNDAQQRNFQRWPVLGTYVWPNNYVGNTYQDEIDFLKQWLTDRLNWMDANMFGSCGDLGLPKSKKQSFEVFPNPSNDVFHVILNETLSSPSVEIFDISGKAVYRKENITTSAFDIPVEFSPGLYTLIIKNGSTINYTKIRVSE